MLSDLLIASTPRLQGSLTHFDSLAVAKHLSKRFMCIAFQAEVLCQQTHILFHSWQGNLGMFNVTLLVFMSSKML